MRKWIKFAGFFLSRSMEWKALLWLAHPFFFVSLPLLLTIHPLPPFSHLSLFFTVMLILHSVISIPLFPYLPLSLQSNSLYRCCFHASQSQSPSVGFTSKRHANIVYGIYFLKRNEKQSLGMQSDNRISDNTKKETILANLCHELELISLYYWNLASLLSALPTAINKQAKKLCRSYLCSMQLNDIQLNHSISQTNKRNHTTIPFLIKTFRVNRWYWIEVISCIWIPTKLRTAKTYTLSNLNQILVFRRLSEAKPLANWRWR